MKKKGFIAIYFVFIMFGIIILMAATVFGPMSSLFTSHLYSAGESIITQANDTISQINDTTVRNKLITNFNKAQDKQAENIEINTDMFTYSAIIVIVLGAIIIFLYARRITEIGGVF